MSAGVGPVLWVGERREEAFHLKLSIIVPTKDEAQNIELLLNRIERAVDGMRTEVVFVDDSSDETPQRIRELGPRFALDVSLVVRPPGRQHGGLGGAVVDGLRVAHGQWVCVMDADLQHPPELIPSLLVRAEEAGADLVLGSRLITGGSVAGLGPFRSVVSRVLAVSARTLFPQQLRGLSDPLTGFFLARRSAVKLDCLCPDGFKILLEILIRCPGLRVSEVPLQFGSRHAGRSKGTFGEGLRLLRQFVHLADPRLVRFLAAGASGLLVNNLILAVLTESLRVHYLLSAALATQGSTLWNFDLTETWVFPDRRHSRSKLQRMGMFFLMNNAALALRGPILFALTSGLGLHYVVSNILSLVLLTVLRYALAGKWIWRRTRPVQPWLVSPAQEAYSLTQPLVSGTQGDTHAPRIRV